MAEQSHREEMNEAIRAQRERQAAGRTQQAGPEPPAKPPLSKLLSRLRGK